MSVHWGQCAEDVIVHSLLREIHFEGFYVDVGAHHPTAVSNTYYFHRLGWRGINIDASKQAIQKFEEKRPRDINLHLGVSKDIQTLEYHRFENSLFNTFDTTMADTWCEYSQKLKSEFVLCKPLSTILSEYLTVGTEIDLLSIDVEGFECDVVESNDWTRYRPRVVVIEQLARMSIDLQSESELFKLMTKWEYRCVAIAGHSQYFLREDTYQNYVKIQTA